MTNWHPRLFAAAITLVLWAWALCACAGVPASARQYQRQLTAQAHATWGLNAPTAVFAGQIETESRWRPKVCSAFACGLAQFTAATAKTISAQHRLGVADVYNPAWAIQALVLYDHDLYAHMSFSATACDAWAFTLSAYNGGLGWVPKDRALAKQSHADTTRWFGAVELYTRRARAYAAENRAYPRLILLQRQAHYAAWGGLVSCPLKAHS